MIQENAHTYYPRLLVRAIAFFLLLLPGMVKAQNLVPNPSFEQYTSCPTNISQIDRAIGWMNLGITCDYYNECCTTDTADVPTNVCGHQWASEGAGYVGLGYYPQYGKEYAQAQLSAPLIPGQITYMSMRVAAGGFGHAFGMGNASWAADRIGMHFTVHPLSLFTYYGQFEFNSSPLFMINILQDTSAWVTLAGSFVPDSAYEYLQLGNFFADSLCSYSVLDPGGDFDFAYAFVDEVCVSSNPGVCDLAGGIEDIHNPGLPLTLVCQGASVQLELGAWAGKRHELMLVDGIGRVCWKGNAEADADSVAIPTYLLDTGIYLIRITDRSGAPHVLRLLKL